MSDLARLIWAIVSRFPGGISAKKLVKLLYFLDLRAAERLGYPISGATYTYHLFGPFPSGFFAARDELLDECITLSFMPAFDFDWHVHRPLRPCPPESLYGEGARAVITEVMQELGSCSGWRLERLSKTTEPMKQARRGDILRLTPPRRTDRQRAVWQRAGIPVDEIERKVQALTFSNEEQAHWAEQEVELVRDLEPLRKRANTACISGELPDG